MLYLIYFSLNIREEAVEVIDLKRGRECALHVSELYNP